MTSTATRATTMFRGHTRRVLLSLGLVLGLGAGQQAFAQATQKVRLTTSMGDIVLELDKAKAPKTVDNFVQYVKAGHYDGTIFHRVIEGFMIQGGDPLGTGTGDPGYSFEDEFQSGRTFDRVGLLAMANAGPGTNGSQFFITTSTPTYLNNKHTIFGEVVKGFDVVEAISKVPKGRGDRPITPVVIENISISSAP